MNEWIQGTRRCCESTCSLSLASWALPELGASRVLRDSLDSVLVRNVSSTPELLGWPGLRCLIQMGLWSTPWETHCCPVKIHTIGETYQLNRRGRGEIREAIKRAFQAGRNKSEKWGLFLDFREVCPCHCEYNSSNNCYHFLCLPCAGNSSWLLNIRLLIWFSHQPLNTRCYHHLIDKNIETQKVNSLVQGHT